MAWTLQDAQTLINYAHWQNSEAMQYAVLAWLNRESGSLASSGNAGTNNPLNLRGDSNAPSNAKGFAIYPTVNLGLQAAATRLTTSPYYGIINSAGKNGDPAAFLDAVATSPWDNGFWTDPKTGKRTNIPAGGYGLSYDPNVNTYQGTNSLIGGYNTSIGLGSNSRASHGIDNLSAIQGQFDISPAAFLNQLVQTGTNTITNSNPDSTTSTPQSQFGNLFGGITGAVGNVVLILIALMFIYLGARSLIGQATEHGSKATDKAMLALASWAKASTIGGAGYVRQRVSGGGRPPSDGTVQPVGSLTPVSDAIEEAPPEAAPSASSEAPRMAESPQTSNIEIVRRGQRTEQGPSLSRDDMRMAFINQLRSANQGYIGRGKTRHDVEKDIARRARKQAAATVQETLGSPSLVSRIPLE